MNSDRTVKFSLVKPDGKTREIDCGTDTVTMYVKSDRQEIVVLPDVTGFRVHVAKHGDEIRRLVIEVGDDGGLTIGWNEFDGSFETSVDDLGRLIVKPLAQVAP